MREPIKSGDKCLVISGALGDKGPNVGKEVVVGKLRGEHSQFGRIWRCHGEGLTTEYGGIGTEADFAQSWLQKIEPPPLKTESEKKELTA